MVLSPQVVVVVVGFDMEDVLGLTVVGLGHRWVGCDDASFSSVNTLYL